MSRKSIFSSGLERLVVVEAHVAADGDDGIERDAVLAFYVGGKRTHERDVPVVVGGTRLAEGGVAERRGVIGALDGERRELATCGTVREHGT